MKRKNTTDDLSLEAKVKRAGLIVKEGTHFGDVLDRNTYHSRVGSQAQKSRRQSIDTSTTPRYIEHEKRFGLTSSFCQDPITTITTMKSPVVKVSQDFEDETPKGRGLVLNNKHKSFSFSGNRPPPQHHPRQLICLDTPTTKRQTAFMSKELDVMRRSTGSIKGGFTSGERSFIRKQEDSGCDQFQQVDGGQFQADRFMRLMKNDINDRLEQIHLRFDERIK